MRTLLMIGLLVVSLSGQALSMGHPHNVFAARKQMRAKAPVSLTKRKALVCSSWQTMVQIDKDAFSKRLLSALSRMRPSPSY